jgi:2-polyprenyl-3-methyl-5-hydroxy-6-metoxy-1,4-benzoquinol methylase
LLALAKRLQYTVPCQGRLVSRAQFGLLDMSEDTYFAVIGKLKGDNEVRRLRHQMANLYSTVDFRGKTVLDIGGGTGYHALYAAVRGATSATIIEPEQDGSQDTMIETFNAFRAGMGIDNVDLLKTTVQAYESKGRRFDVVLIHNAINHFDEPACITLRQSAESQAIYRKVFKSIASLINPGGILIVSDCSSNNFYVKFGLRNPIDPSIEWHKHQPPGEWAKVAAPEGLKLEDVRWTSPTRFGSLGQMLFGNALAAYFFTSHFVATFRLR